MGSSDDEDNGALMLRGQAEIWQYMLRYADSMALKCALELRLADIIHSHPSPITLSQIASTIASQQHSPNNSTSTHSLNCLQRIMRLLVRRRIFSVSHPPGGGEAVYGLTHSSRWLLHDSELSLAPYLSMAGQDWCMSSFHYFAQCVKHGDLPFKKAHGVEFYDFMSQNVEASAMFNDAMATDSRIVSKAVLMEYKEGFDNLGSLVDVGGGIGWMAAQIVKSYPHIKAINYDLPRVIATAPAYDGVVSHIGGDMFESIPSADAVLLKSVLHNWSDEDCVKILKNCKKAIPKKTGKLVIVDVVLQPKGNDVFDDVGLVFDLVMLALCSGGKERTELEWKKLLEEGGFPCYKIIKIPAMQSIIEAYPY